MDFKVKRVCPNCSQYLGLLPDETTRGKICRLPLTLQCGHPICQDCLLGIIKFNEPIECKVCHNVATVATTDANLILKDARFIYETFPVHFHVLGELSMKLLESTEKSQVSDEAEYSIDVQSLLESNRNVSKCAECSEETDKMCQNCDSAFCESCFTEIHSNYLSFKKHVYKKIELKLEPNICDVHRNKPISYYCNNCSRSCCNDCCVTVCKDHQIVHISQMHAKYMEELNAVSPKVDESLRHLINTAVQIGDTLKSYEQRSKVCAISQMILNVRNNFAKLHATMQKQEYETIAALEKLKREQKESLLKAKEDVIVHVNETRHIIDSISAVRAAQNNEEIKLSSILESAKQSLNIPWCLQKSEDTLKLRVQEELHEQIHNYISVECESRGAYSLVYANVADLPPATIENMPRDIPELARDTSKQDLISTKSSTVPKFIPKYGFTSTSSLHSGDIPELARVESKPFKVVHRIEKPMKRERTQSGISKQEIEADARPPVDLSARDKGPIRLEVELLESHSPSLIYLNMKCLQQEMMEFYNSLQETYCSDETIPAELDWKVGDRCCAKCAHSKTWSRARILELDDQVAKLFFVDFAVVEEVALSEVRVLFAEFLSHRDAAIKCHLNGIMPGCGESWPLITVEHFKDRLSQYQRFFMTKRGALKDNSLPIELWVYHTTLGGALEPNTAEWRSLNTDIIENGLAIPQETAESNEGEDHSLSFLELWPGYGSDLKGWLPLEPFTSLELKGTVTHVSRSGVLHVAECSNKDRAIERLVNKMVKKENHNCAEIGNGDICLARYSADNMFYRSKIIQVKPELCIVRYVDYGNQDRCALHDIITFPGPTALHNIPMQAHKCVLAHIVPAKDTWPSTVTKYLYQILIEKVYDIKIVGDPIGQLIPIEVKVNDTVWLHEHLIQFGLALESADWTDYIQSIEDETDLKDASTDSGDNGEIDYK